MLPCLGQWNAKLKYSISAAYHSTWVAPNQSPRVVELPAKLATFSMAHHRTWKTIEKKTNYGYSNVDDVSKMKSDL